MNEDDTFRMLKSLTEDEAISMYTDVYLEMYQELNADPTIDVGIPLSVIAERLDPILKPYGWSFDKVLSAIIGKSDFT